MRWTEDEAREFGLRKDKDGNWYQPAPSRTARSGRKGSNTREMPKSQCAIRIGAEKQEEQENREGKTGEVGNKKGVKETYVIRVVSYRHRDMDPDNLCPKVWIDELVKLDYLPDDIGGYVDRVVKVVEVIKKTDQERTEIEIWKQRNS